MPQFAVEGEAIAQFASYCEANWFLKAIDIAYFAMSMEGLDALTSLPYGAKRSIAQDATYFVAS